VAPSLEEQVAFGLGHEIVVEVLLGAPLAVLAIDMEVLTAFALDAHLRGHGVLVPVVPASLAHLLQLGELLLAMAVEVVAIDGGASDLEHGHELVDLGSGNSDAQERLAVVLGALLPHARNTLGLCGEMRQRVGQPHTAVLVEEQHTLGMSIGSCRGMARGRLIVPHHVAHTGAVHLRQCLAHTGVLRVQVVRCLGELRVRVHVGIVEAVGVLEGIGEVNILASIALA